MSEPATPLDTETLALVRLAAAVAVGEEPAMRQAFAGALEAGVAPAWVEELLLQSILMAGYPRAIVAFGFWRKVSGLPAPVEDPDSEYGNLPEWEARGEQTCARVYGGNYARLRRNIRDLHPAVDRWMLVEGYGRTLGRPGLDLLRRELCTVVQTAVLHTNRQLHSHLRGALHSGATFAQVDATLAVVIPLLSHEEWKTVKELWSVVRAGWAPED
jgi:4-carboxymuconolactone decarboxylase